MKIYKSKTSFIFDILLGFFPVVSIVCLLAVLIFTILNAELNSMTIIAIILMLLTIIICALMLHARLKTVYTIGDGKLVATVGIHKRRIDITTIQKIKYPAKHDLVGNRPALGMQGMYIYVISGFNLFVSPEHPQQFIEDLHKVNPGIQIVDT